MTGIEGAFLTNNNHGRNFFFPILVLFTLLGAISARLADLHLQGNNAIGAERYRFAWFLACNAVRSAQHGHQLSDDAFPQYRAKFVEDIGVVDIGGSKEHKCIVHGSVRLPDGRNLTWVVDLYTTDGGNHWLVTSTYMSNEIN